MKPRPPLAALATLAALGTTGCPSRTPELELAPAPADTAAAAAPPAAPWTLTASDGSGLALTRVEARGVIEGPLAFTELHLHFRNPEPRIREGTFAITLPPGASIARFAMASDAGFLEAEVVATARARFVYEEHLHRRQDPALLERGPGGVFTARVFPISPNADKHLVISFAHELASGGYVLPLRGLPAIPRIDVEVTAPRADGTCETHELHERSFRPDRDFTVSAAGPAAVTAGTLVAAVVPIGGAPAAADAPDALALLVDTSGSRAPDFARYAHSVAGLASELAARYGRHLALEVVAFDQEARSIYRGPAGGYGGAGHAALLERGAGGVSDLGAAIDWLARSRAYRRAALVTDGVITAGPELPAIAARLVGIPRLERLDVVLAGASRDERVAAELAHASLPRRGVVLDLDRGGAADVAAGLGERVLPGARLHVPGAEWVIPRALPPMRAGQRVLVYAQLEAPARSIELFVAGARHELPLAAASPPLLERAIAGAVIEELEDRLRAATAAGHANAAELREQVERRAVAARVISSQTAMLVLETEADYARYGIDRSALAEVLTVGHGGLEAVRRPRPAPSSAFESLLVADSAFDAGRDSVRLRDEGSTSTAMALEEGIMGRRVRPAWKSRQEAIEHARMAGVLGSAARSHGASSSIASSISVTGALPALSGAPPDDQPNHEPESEPEREPLKGRFADVMQALAEGRRDHALALAQTWHAEEPADVLALVALGETLEALGRTGAAARTYGSIIDLYPSRAHLRRFAGQRLERVASRGLAAARELAIDTYRRAAADRPDQVTGHRLLAYALLRAGRHAEAFDAILAAVDLRPARTAGHRGGVARLLAEDAGMIAAAYFAAGGPASLIHDELRRRDLSLATEPSTRFVLYWETDANDVDLHVRDARGGHASYQQLTLPSGGELYDDVTTGFGPECFAIDGAPLAGPYRLSVHYYAQRAMGYGMGMLQIQRFTGRRIELEDRPYVIMSNDATVELGEVRP